MFNLFGKRAATKSAHHDHQMTCTSLCCARPGARVCVLEVGGSDIEACKLRDLGVREGAIVSLLSHGDPILVRVDGARIGLAESAAQNVLCEYLPDAK